MTKILISVVLSFFSNTILASPESSPYANFQAIEFEKDKVGIIFNNGVHNSGSELNNLVYGIVETKNVKIISKNEFKLQFPNAKSVDNFASSDSSKLYKSKYTNCEENPEGPDLCQKVNISVDKEIIMIDFNKMKICNTCYISQIERWKNNLWISFLYPSEYWLTGHGLHVFDISKKNKIKTINSHDLIEIIKKDPTEKFIWTAGSSGVSSYNEKLSLIHSCIIKHGTKEKNAGTKTASFDFTFNCTK